MQISRKKNLIFCCLVFIAVGVVWTRSKSVVALRKCGSVERGGSGMTRLSEFISVALDRVSTGPKRSVCALEVGTADGTGTTVAFNFALYEHCSAMGGSEFYLYSFEGLENRVVQAREFWRESGNVEIVHGIVMRDQETLNEYVISNIDAGTDYSNQFPSKGFYQHFYNKSFAQNMRDIPNSYREVLKCVPDIVLIDSTRYAHAGIIATLLSDGMASRDTVFVVENDLWLTGNGTWMDERTILEKYWNLLDVMTAKPDGEAFDWISFRIQ